MATKLRVLFVNYGESHNNSAHHIFGFARELGRRGHDCLVAVVKSLRRGVVEAGDGYRLANYRTVLDCGGPYTEGRPADLLHLWTPREGVRKFSEAYRARWGAQIPVVVHLEDNEEVIFERFSGRVPHELRREPPETWSSLCTLGLTHPLHGPALLQRAEAVTVLHSSLSDLVPPGKLCHELPPIGDVSFFHPGPRDDGLVRKLDLPPQARLLSYHGNDHPANTSDMRHLYEAASEAMDHREDLFFLRTGILDVARYAGLGFRGGPRCRELGFVDRETLGAVMRLADVFVQPGNPDAFNRRRLPAKVPEYLLLAKPLIIGQANIGMELKEQGAARVLQDMSPHAMAAAVLSLLDHPEEARSLGLKGREFALRRFDASMIGKGLEDFYRLCLAPSDTRAGLSAASRSRLKWAWLHRMVARRRRTANA